MSEGLNNFSSSAAAAGIILKHEPGSKISVIALLRLSSAEEKSKFAGSKAGLFARASISPVAGLITIAIALFTIILLSPAGI